MSSRTVLDIVLNGLVTEVDAGTQK